MTAQLVATLALTLLGVLFGMTGGGEIADEQKKGCFLLALLCHVCALALVRSA